MRNYANHTKIIFGGTVVFALILSVLAHFQSRFPGDLQVTLAFQSIHSLAFLDVMKGISYLVGEWRAPVVVIIIGIIVWWSLGRLEGGMLVLSGFIATFDEAFKMAIDRPRPTADLVNVLAVESGKSFPSGHAFFAVVVLGFWGYLILTRQRRRYLNVLTASVFLILILCIGFSRIYLGAHWASDVVGGYVVGSPFLALEIWLYHRLKLRFGKRVPQPR